MVVFRHDCYFCTCFQRAQFGHCVHIYSVQELFGGVKHTRADMPTAAEGKGLAAEAEERKSQQTSAWQEDHSVPTGGFEKEVSQTLKDEKNAADCRHDRLLIGVPASSRYKTPGYRCFGVLKIPHRKVLQHQRYLLGLRRSVIGGFV